MRLLIVEDDREAADYLRKALREAGHVAELARDGEEGLAAALDGEFDVLVIDRMLPKREGLSLISELRARGNTTPVLILSALGQVDDRVTGLRAGGDDYLAKPYAFSELLARIEALSRRTTPQSGETLYRVGDLELDRLSHRVSRGWQGNSPSAARVSLTRISDAARRTSRHPYDAARERLGLSFRPTDERDRRPCLAPALED